MLPVAPPILGLLLFKMLLVGLWHGGLSDESVEEMANVNLHVMRFPGLDLEDAVPDHSVLSRFRTRLTAAQAWDGLLEQINRQIQAHNVTVTKGYHIDASITHSPRKPKTNPSYEVVNDCDERDDETDAQAKCVLLKPHNLTWILRGVGLKKAANSCLAISNTQR